MSVDTPLINEIARLISAHQLDPSSATLPDTTYAVIAAVRRHDQRAVSSGATFKSISSTRGRTGRILNGIWSAWLVVLLVLVLLGLAFNLYVHLRY